jgi:hypothetical protein
MKPTWIMLSDFDELNASNKQFYERLDCEQKGFLSIVCGSHFLVWEKNHRAFRMRL